MLGSSLLVQPAASLPWLTLRAGGRVVVVNRDPTALDEHASGAGGTWRRPSAPSRPVEAARPGCRGSVKHITLDRGADRADRERSRGPGLEGPPVAMPAHMRSAEGGPSACLFAEEGRVNRPTITDLVTATGELATLPTTVIALLDVLKDTTTSADRVCVVLERDPAMTANVLKLANSAYYGVRRTIGNVRDALVMLGNRAVTTLAFATGMAPVLRRDLEGYGEGRDSFWRHSLIAAAAASTAADLGGFSRWRTQCFTAGLVHDVGMLVIDRWLVAEGRQLPAFGDEAMLRQAERELLGFDHAETGAALAEAWGFPELLVSALRYHHTPLEAVSDRQVVAAVAAGDLVATVISAGREARVARRPARRAEPPGLRRRGFRGPAP